MPQFELGPGTVDLSQGTDSVFSSCWSPELGLFLVIGDVTTSTVQGIAYTSSDGYSWTRNVHTVTSSVVHRNVVWVPELSLFVKIADTINAGTPSGNAQTSPDGVNWTNRTVPTTPTTHSWRGLAWSPDLGLLCAAGSGGGTCRSSDGITWTINTPITGTPNLTGMAWGNGCFVTMSADGDEIWRSTNGSTWTQVASFGDQTTWTRVIYSSELGLFLLIGAGAQNIMTSPDGITWTDRTFDATHVYQQIEYANGLFCIGRRTAGTMFLYTSPDGITWTEQEIPTISPSGTGTFILHRNLLTWSPELELLIIDGVESTDTKLVVVLVPVDQGVTVTDVVPGSGSVVGGDLVEIIGTGFQAGADVVIDHVFATDITVVSPTLITCRVPAHPIPAVVDVTVTNPDNSFGTGVAQYEYTQPIDPETGLPEVVPSINWFGSGCSPAAIVPNRGTMAGGTAVTIHGTGFKQDSTVLFGGTPATSVVVDPSGTSITCITPPHQVGAVDIVIIAP